MIKLLFYGIKITDLQSDTKTDLFIIYQYIM